MSRTFGIVGPCKRLMTFYLKQGVNHYSVRHSSAILSNIPTDLPTLTSREGQKVEKLTNEIVRKEKSRLFGAEKKRQVDLIPRMEKIEVTYQGPSEPTTMILNKNLSTPFDVAQHLSEVMIQKSALALVNGNLWDMNRPLEEDCKVELLHFHQDNPFQVNRAFWRSCSFMLGSVLETVMQDDYFVELHSFPAPNVASGSFVYDADLKLGEWIPSKEELMTISAAMHRLAEKELPFERLDVKVSLASEIFKQNKYKLKQIPSIASKSPSGDTVTLYRVGDHVDISRGPMVGNTSFVGRRCTIACAHRIEHDRVPMHRFQGVALPKNVHLNHFAYGILERRAAILNVANLSREQNDKK